MQRSAVQALEMRVLGWDLLQEGFERYKLLRSAEPFPVEEWIDCFYEASEADAIEILPVEPPNYEKSIHVIPKSESLFRERFSIFSRSRVLMEMYWNNTMLEKVGIEEIVNPALLNKTMRESIELLEIRLRITSPKFDPVIIRFPADEEKNLRFSVTHYVEGNRYSTETMMDIVETSTSFDEWKQRGEALKESWEEPDDTIVIRDLTIPEMSEFRKLVFRYSPKAKQRQEKRNQRR